MIIRQCHSTIFRRFLGSSTIRSNETAVQGTTTPTTQPGLIRRRIESIVDAYEDFIGIKAVKLAQTDVMEVGDNINYGKFV